MPLETATYLDQLVSTNPADTDSEGQGAAHLRLIKATLLATFPNFTAAALNSTQAEIDASVAATSAGNFKLAAGTAGAPALALAADATTGVYSAGAGKINISIAGTELLELDAVGLNLTAGTLQFSGVDVFPLQSPAYGALSIPIGAFQAGAVLYADIQNETASTLLGNPTGSAAAPSEITLGTGLSFVGSALTNTVGASIASASDDLLIVNDATNPTTKVNITASEAVLSNGSGGTIYASGINVSVVTTSVGAGGMGTTTGTRAVNTEYHWWLISDGTLATLIAGGELPSGYTFAKRVGANFTDGSSNLFLVKQTGREANYALVASTNTATYRTIASGNVGNTLVAAAWAGLIPSTATRIRVNVVTGSITAVGPNALSVFFVAETSITGVTDMILESANIYWSSNSGSGAISAVGWHDPI